MGSLDAAENSFSSLTVHLEDLSPQHSQVPDVHNPFFEAVRKSMDVLTDDAYLARLQNLIDAVALTELTSPARSVLDRLRERLPYLVSIARSQKSISSALLEKTAQRASIIDEIHLTISPYQKVSSLLREKEEVNTKMASLHAEY